MFCLVEFSARSADQASGLEAFRQLSSGRLPIKEAVVLRTVSRPNGSVINKEWFRFGYQRGSWFAERLAPGTNDSRKLEHLANRTVCGASFTHRWTISDQNIHVAYKDAVTNNVPEEFGNFYRRLMLESVTLGIGVGIPNLSIEQIQWDGLSFGSALGTATNIVIGRVALGSNGLPEFADCLAIGSSSAGEIRYEWTKGGALAAFTKTFRRAGSNSYRYEFISLVIGAIDLDDTDGFVPSMFAFGDVPRRATLWTEEGSRTVNQSELPIAWVSRQREPLSPHLGGSPMPTTWPFGGIRIALSIVTLALVAIWAFFRFKQWLNRNNRA